jgi:hypothetical protein
MITVRAGRARLLVTAHKDYSARQAATFDANPSLNQLIGIDGKVMATAMMVKTQHLIWRKDVFDDPGMGMPGDDSISRSNCIPLKAERICPANAASALGVILNDSKRP